MKAQAEIQPKTARAGRCASLRLLVIARAQAVEEHGEVRFQNLDGNYLDSIAAGLGRMLLLAPVQRIGRDATAERYRRYSYCFRSKNIELRDLAEHKAQAPSLLQGLHMNLRQLGTVRRNLRDAEAVFVMMSTWRAALAALLARRKGLPVVLYSGNDWFADLESTYKYQGPLARVAFPLFRRLCALAERKAMQAADLRILNGVSLVEKYSDLPGRTVETKPLITFSEGDFHRREDTCQGPVIRLLCVAGIMPRKGIHFLLRALRQLCDKGMELRLDLVGEAIPDYGQEMRALTRELELDERVAFRGYVANGPDLHRCYREADLFILPSLSEGFPRVIFEAMSQSLPVVASRIHNIHGRLGDRGYLGYAEPANADDLARAIQSLVADGAKRREMIAKGMEYVTELLRQRPGEQFLVELEALLERRQEQA